MKTKKTKKETRKQEMKIMYQDQEFRFPVEDIRKICFKIGDKEYFSDTIILYAQIDRNRNLYKRLASYKLDDNVIIKLNDFDDICRSDKRFVELYRYRLIVINQALFSSFRKYHYLIDFYLSNKLFHLTYRKSKEWFPISKKKILQAKNLQDFFLTKTHFSNR